MINVGCTPSRLSRADIIPDKPRDSAVNAYDSSSRAQQCVTRGTTTSSKGESGALDKPRADSFDFVIAIVRGEVSMLRGEFPGSLTSL